MTIIRCIACAFVLAIATFGHASLAAVVLPYDGSPLEKTAENFPGEDYRLMIGKRSFSLSQIEKLPTFQVKIKTYWGEDGVFIGVKFNDLLREAGIEEFRRVMVRASNDYKITVSASDVGVGQTLLVYRIDDAYLALNDKGPFWLVWPEQAEALLTGEEQGTQWIWGVVEIRKVR